MTAHSGAFAVLKPPAVARKAAFAGVGDIPAALSLIALVNHMKGASVPAPPVGKIAHSERAAPDLRDVKGQESAKRAGDRRRWRAQSSDVEV